LTRQELREQVQHDRFTDGVSDALNYAARNQQKLIRWGVIGAVVLALIGAGFWYSSYQTSLRQQDLQAAFDVYETPVGAAAPGAKSFSDETARRQAGIKAFSDVVNKDGNSREGLIARYYRGTLAAAGNDSKTAESDLRAVSDSSSDFAVLARVALAQLYAGENKTAEARSVLDKITGKPTALVSKAQADIMVAQLERTTNPQAANKILQSLKTNQSPAVARAVEQLSSAK
jgi:predicted negative regulator of RcsB-dependent stress response